MSRSLLELSRRRFGHTSGALVGAFVTGCGRDQGPRPVDTRLLEGETPTGTGGRDPVTAATGGQGSGGSGGQATPPPGGSAGAAGGPTCGDVTATNIQGPFFLPNSPERPDIRGSEPGPRLSLSGVVLGPDCAPISGALVDFWQANEEGVYDNEGDTFRGHQFTDEDGRYRLESIVPGRYLNGAQFRPAHIHVKVSAGGQTLTTQLYFPGDPFNDVDSFIDFSLIIAVHDEDENGITAGFDFILNAR